MVNQTKYSVSIVVPVRDEAGTILKLVEKVPSKLGRFTEVVFVEGFSKDGSWEEIKRAEKLQSRLKVKGYRYMVKKGKAGAVWEGIDKAKGDIIIILDSDLSVSPAETTKFYKKLTNSDCNFVNGSRFLLPKEKGAMRFFNHLGNKFFALCFSVILNRKITDTLCGTKAFFKKDFILMRKKVNPKVFDEDPFGDFSLLFGARELNLLVSEVPVNYKARVYGESKINPFRDGIALAAILVKDLFRFLFKNN